MDIKELDALLASAKRPETVVPVCLRGDLQAEWETLDKRLNDLRSRNFGKIGMSQDHRDLAQRIVELEATMSASTIDIRLRGLDRRAWRDLVSAHPARKDNETDGVLGVNQETFFDALVAECAVEPEMTADQVSTFLDSITSSQFDKLADAAWGLNRRDVNVPFSYSASLVNPTGGETSKQQSGSGSRTRGSRGGSRAKS
jgi:hypothetical protein